MVSIGELELDDVADCCIDGVGYEGILWTAYDHGDDLVGATKWVGLFLISMVQMEKGVCRHTLDTRQSVESLECRTRKRTCSGGKGDSEDE